MAACYDNFITDLRKAGFAERLNNKLLSLNILREKDMELSCVRYRIYSVVPHAVCKYTCCKETCPARSAPVHAAL
jgi:hypothetical protein